MPPGVPLLSMPARSLIVPLVAVKFSVPAVVLPRAAGGDHDLVAGHVERPACHIDGAGAAQNLNVAAGLHRAAWRTFSVPVPAPVVKPTLVSVNPPFPTFSVAVAVDEIVEPPKVIVPLPCPCPVPALLAVFVAITNDVQSTVPLSKFRLPMELVVPKLWLPNVSVLARISTEWLKELSVPVCELLFAVSPSLEPIVIAARPVSVRSRIFKLPVAAMKDIEPALFHVLINNLSTSRTLVPAPNNTRPAPRVPLPSAPPPTVMVPALIALEVLDIMSVPLARLPVPVTLPPPMRTSPAAPPLNAKLLRL